MVKSNKGTVEIVGTQSDIVAEAGSLLTAMLDKNVISEEKLDEIVAKAKEMHHMTPEQMLDKLREATEHDASAKAEVLKSLLEAILDSEEE